MNWDIFQEKPFSRRKLFICQCSRDKGVNGLSINNGLPRHLQRKVHAEHNIVIITVKCGKCENNYSKTIEKVQMQKTYLTEFQSALKSCLCNESDKYLLLDPRK